MKKIFFLCFLCLGALSVGFLYWNAEKPIPFVVSNDLPRFPITENKPLVVVITSYNNEAVCKRNLKSVFDQTYQNYRVIYIDDCSTDQTYATVQNYIIERKQSDRVTLIRNTTRKLKTPNLYAAYHSCKNHEIIVCLDGDDWLAHNKALETINRYYQNPDVWLTHGSALVYPQMKQVTGGKLQAIYEKGTIRNEPFFLVSMLRTFYAGLVKQIPLKDFFYKNTLLINSEDAFIMYALIEMAPLHTQFISDILYIINDDNPLRNYKMVGSLENSLFQHIRSLSPYPPLPKSFSPILPSHAPKLVDTAIIFSEDMARSLPPSIQQVVLIKNNGYFYSNDQIHWRKGTKKELIRMLQDPNQFVFISKNQMITPEDTPLEEAVHALQQTKASSFFYSLDRTPLSCEPIFENIYAMRAQETIKWWQIETDPPFLGLIQTTSLMPLINSNQLNINEFPLCLQTILPENEVFLLTKS